MLSLQKHIISHVFVGRSQEMEILEGALHTVHRGAGQCVLISGETGIGKSRLISEVRQRPAAKPFLILQGYCSEQDIAFPYGPVVGALRTYLSERSPPETRKILGSLAAEVMKLVPELALMLPKVSPTPALEPEAEKRRLFETLTQFFSRLAAAQPLLIILEDLHWSDETTLDFLQWFLRRISGHRILLLATYRTEEVGPRLADLLTALNRHHLGHEITLVPLSRDEVDMMVRGIFDLPQSPTAEFLDLLYSLTEGNPFFVEEVLRELTAAGEIYYADGHWHRKPITEVHVPRTVQDAVQRRFKRIGETEQRVLTLAAVVGRRFSFALLQELAQMEEAQLLQSIQRLIDAQLLAEESADRFGFRHPVTREAVYSTLLQRQRQALHQRVAEILELRYADGLDAHVAELAYHYYTGGAWTKACEYSWRAGEKALSLYAPDEAIQHLTRALEAAQKTTAPPLIQILRARGRAYETVGKFEASRHDFEAALRAAQQSHNGAAEWQVLIDLGLLWASRDYVKAGQYFQHALERAQALGESAMVGHSLNRLGNWYANVGCTGEGLHYHQRALELFEALNDRHGVVETLDLLGMVSQLNNDLIQSHLYYQRAIDMARELNSRRELSSSLACLTLCTASYHQNLEVTAIGLEEATRAAQEATKVARDIGWRAGEAYAELMLAMCLGPQGEYGQALEAAHHSLAVAEEIEHRQWLIGAHAALGILHLDLLALDLARTHLEKALALAQEVGTHVWTASTAGYLASAYVAQGQLALAEAVLANVLPSATPITPRSHRLCWYARGELALARGEAETALDIADSLRASAANATPKTVLPRLWKLRGEALAALGRTHEAEAVLHAAQAAALEQGARSLLWHIHVALGRVYHAQRRRDEARREFSAAHDLILSLATTVPDEGLRRNFVARAMAAMPRLPTPSPSQLEKTRFGGLTAREREVAALIAQGKRNHEIAQILVVGSRTVEAHITRILNKLGFSSRTQIAGWAVENGLAHTTPDRES